MEIFARIACYLDGNKNENSISYYFTWLYKLLKDFEHCSNHTTTSSISNFSQCF
jgi:hypothetical protein